MISILEGDVLQSKAQTLVNSVNRVGVMGKGIALRFKERFPEMFTDYLGRCQRGEVELGRPYLYKSAAPPWILNFPTKDHWRSVSRVADIVRGLEYLAEHYKEWGITSLAFPPLGCGQGRLKWTEVGPVLYRHLSAFDIPVEVYAPYGTPAEQLHPGFLARRAGRGLAPRALRRSVKADPVWVGLVEVLSRVLRERYHWPVGRVMFQKIAYIATEEGLPTGLEFQKGSFGPFSPALGRHITGLVNDGLICEDRLGGMFRVLAGPAFNELRVLYNRQLSQWEPKIRKIADLFMRIQGTRQAEVVATVVFAAKLLRQARAGKPSEREVLAEVMNWKQRRRPQLGEGEVAYTIRNLAALGWLDVRASDDLPLPDEALVRG